MNIETAVLSQNPEDKSVKTVFGWQVVSEERRRSGRQYRTVVTMVRDKDMANYALLNALENKYFSLKNQLIVYKPLEFSTYVLLYLFFILPGLLTTIYKVRSKKRIKEKNRQLQNEMADLLKEAQNV